MPKSDKINIALAFCDPEGGYARHAAVVMASIFANTKSQVCVHVVHDDTLTAENMAKLRSTAGAFGQEVSFVDVTERKGECVLGEKARAFPGAEGMYFRLLIPSLFHFDRVIYLDCDVVVNLDIAELWNVPLNGLAIAAVDERPYPREAASLKEWMRWRLSYRAMRMNQEKYRYFNSGVLVMDLKKIREKYDFLKDSARFYDSFRYITEFADQDCFNYIFLKDCQYLDCRFNNRVDDTSEVEDISNTIWHFYCGDKPWSSYTRPGLDDLYWRYLSMTAYCRDLDELIGTMLSAMSHSRYYHQRTSSCTKRLSDKLKYNLTSGHLLHYPKMFWHAGKAVAEWRRGRHSRSAGGGAGREDSGDTARA